MHKFSTSHKLQAMSNYSNLNMGNNIRIRDTQFFWYVLAENIGKSDEMSTKCF
jgi:hypothetical protein